MIDLTGESVYIAGPMRGYQEFNLPAFFRAESLAIFALASTFNPARRDEEVGFRWAGLEGTSEELEAHGFDLREALLADTFHICKHATAILALPGWADSPGASAEVALGKALGLRLLTIGDREQIEELTATLAWETS